MSHVLIVGATKGLGAELVKQYAARSETTVYGTTRGSEEPKGFPRNVKWIHGINMMDERVGDALVKQLNPSSPLSAVVR